ncbi:MAG: GDYXXLXY domain-containing protein, partial [Verrucomicrobia bacterium]|nr:GDYXXLXY domain-containing protein [Verrucomicrobiota bacterium]
GYKISDVPLSLFTPAITNAPPPGKTIFVALEPRGEFYEVAHASTEKISAAANQVVLHGKSQRWWNTADQKTVRVEYGLERYYVREGTGRPQGKLTVQVAVPAYGRAVIKQVFVDGKPYADVMKHDAR